MTQGNRIARIACALSGMLAVSACAMPDTYTVRSGLDPRSVDDEVRFRTNYYFTVLNVCYDKDGNLSSVPGLPAIDAVYRYRMTGKANALYTSTRFESGLLAADAVDPLGAAGDVLRELFDEDRRVIDAPPPQTPVQTPTQASPGTGNSGAPPTPAAAATAPSGGAAALSASSKDLLKDDALEEILEKAKKGTATALEESLAIARDWSALSAGLTMAAETPLKAFHDAVLAQSAAAKAANAVGAADDASPAKWQPALEAYATAVEALAEARAALPDLASTGGPRVGTMDTAITELSENLTPDLQSLLVDFKAHNAAEQVMAVMASNQALRAAINTVSCLDGNKPRQGFLILGPERWRYAPSTRLAMAMSTSADPLIESLNKLAALSRSERQGGAERMLPVSDAETQALDLTLRANATSDAAGLSGFLSEAITELDDQ